MRGAGRERKLSSTGPSLPRNGPRTRLIVGATRHPCGTIWHLLAKGSPMDLEIVAMELITTRYELSKRVELSVGREVAGTHAESLSVALHQRYQR
jgi:hypothetical protein